MSEDEREESKSAGAPEVTVRGLVTPRTQIVLIAVGIALFNIVVIGFLIWLIFTH